MKGLFVTGTGTGVGKTWLTRGLARALRRRGDDVAAIKPIETGCDPRPLDAEALARACDRPELADLDGLYRARLPAAPYAATLEGEPAIDLPRVIAAVKPVPAQLHLVEGAGGLLVPLDAHTTLAELATALALPVVLVARDALGVLSHTLTAAECARRRGLEIRAVVLTPSPDDEPSSRTNGRILVDLLTVPVLRFEPVSGEDAALADTAEALVDRLLPPR